MIYATVRKNILKMSVYCAASEIINLWDFIETVRTLSGFGPDDERAYAGKYTKIIYAWTENFNEKDELRCCFILLLFPLSNQYIQEKTTRRFFYRM